MSTSQNNEAFDVNVEQIQAFMDSMVDDGSDQELFVAGYLSGHFSLAVSHCELTDARTITELDNSMRNSLQNAFDNDELQANDQQDAWQFWQKCLDKVG